MPGSSGSSRSLILSHQRCLPLVFPEATNNQKSILIPLDWPGQEAGQYKSRSKRKEISRRSQRRERAGRGCPKSSRQLCSLQSQRSQSTDTGSFQEVLRPEACKGIRHYKGSASLYHRSTRVRNTGPLDGTICYCFHMPTVVTDCCPPLREEPPQTSI